METVQVFIKATMPKRRSVVKANLTSQLISRLVLISGICVTPLAANANVIFQSATSASSGCAGGGSSVDSSQYLAARFTLTASKTLSGIGGRVCGFTDTDDFFAAIVPLGSFLALPSFAPTDVLANSLFNTTFVPGLSGGDSIDLISGVLTPGSYALLIGSGLFGTSGGGFMPEDNLALPGASYFFAPDSSAASPSDWINGGVSGLRFVVEGENIAVEPDIFALLLVGGVVLVYRRNGQAKA
jgi:hypothetical protein